LNPLVREWPDARSEVVLLAKPTRLYGDVWSELALRIYDHKRQYLLLLANKNQMDADFGLQPYVNYKIFWRVSPRYK
jgi:hypothetical protein